MRNNLLPVICFLIAVIFSQCTRYDINNRCCENDYEIITTNYVLPDSFNLYIPQAFTPNGDGVNDIFLPLGRRFEVEEMIIKKGLSTVYESKNRLAAFWDGGDEKDGRYKYTMKIRASNDELLEIKGSVCVLRYGSPGEKLHDEKRELICNCTMPDMIDPREGVIFNTSECTANNLQ